MPDRKNEGNIKMNKATYLMTKEELEAMEDNLTINVMTSYLDLLRKGELAGAANLNLEVTSQQVERMERLVEVGNEPRGKLLEVKAQLAAAQLTLTQAINDREIARLNLMHLMNITEQLAFDIEKPVMPDPSRTSIPPLDTVFEYAMEHLPQIKSARFGIEAQERFLAVQRGQRSPRLYASGIYFSNYSDKLTNPIDPALEYPLNDQIRDNQYREVSVGVQIPFFNRWQVQTNIKKAKISLQDAEYGYQNTILEIQKAIQQYHTEALAALDNFRSAREAVKSSDEAYRFAEERFRVGTGTALEMQEARNQLFESTAQMISSRFVLIFYTKILDFYMGRDIVL
jgi:outer membrane protein